MSIDKILRRALNGAEFPLIDDLASHYAKRLEQQAGPIGAPKWYSRQMGELADAFVRVQKTRFDPVQHTFLDARGGPLTAMSELDFLCKRHDLAKEVLRHMGALRDVFVDNYIVEPEQGRMLLCQVGTELVVAQYRDENLRQSIPQDLLVDGPAVVKPICMLEPDDRMYPEQPVAFYDHGRFRGCGFGVEKGGEIRVYRSLLSNRVATIPVDSGVEVVPLRAEPRVEFEEETTLGHPYRGAWE